MKSPINVTAVKWARFITWVYLKLSACQIIGRDKRWYNDNACWIMFLVELLNAIVYYSLEGMFLSDCSVFVLSNKVVIDLCLFFQNTWLLGKCKISISCDSHFFYWYFIGMLVILSLISVYNDWEQTFPAHITPVTSQR